MGTIGVADRRDAGGTVLECGGIPDGTADWSDPPTGGGGGERGSLY